MLFSLLNLPAPLYMASRSHSDISKPIDLLSSQTSLFRYLSIPHHSHCLLKPRSPLTRQFMGKLSSPLDYFEPHILRNLCDALLLPFPPIFRLNSHNNNNGHNMVDSNNNNKKGNNSAFHKYLQQFVAQ